MWPDRVVSLKNKPSGLLLFGFGEVRVIVRTIEITCFKVVIYISKCKIKVKFYFLKTCRIFLTCYDDSRKST
ncbi:MAG: hypothetical protein C4518_18710 [Desulfobacteraceae bacterium]|nr:MAG: hypothetical protein C4518_18710 [Desulfobacteraceae bacterium]